MSYSYKPPAYYASRQSTGRGSSYADVYSNRTVQQREQNRIEAEAEEKRAAERERIRNARIAKEQAEERKRLAEEERKRKEAEKKAYDAKILSESKKIAPDYRESYDAGNPRTFTEAKQAADETYMQYWYDRANNISKNWTQKDYDLILNPQYENVKVPVDPKRGMFKNERRRKLPENYGLYKGYQNRIKEGVLDFSTEETHKRLINPPHRRGYGKRQYWVSESNQLRQAVEAQADVMKDFLDDAGVPIVQKYEDLDGFKRPDSFRGEGIYLNTGTAAHIDWDAGLKRMQRYQTSPDAELGTYSNVFVRPDPEGIAKPLAFVGAITGNPWLTAASSVAAGGDIEDAIKAGAKGYAIGQITAPILEDVVADFGIDKDLLGMDAEAFSEGMMDVQHAVLDGGNVEVALLKEFGVDAVKQLGSALPDVDIDLPESQFFSDLGDALEPVVGAVRAGGRAIDDAVLQPIKTGLEPVVDVAQQGIDVLQQAGRDFDDTFIDPIDDVIDAFGSEVVDPTLQTLGEVGQDIIDPIDAFIDAIDSPLGDLLGAGGDLLGGMLGGSQGQQQQRTASTPTEGLFDKELFKFDTEIKSTQEMLSPMMNLRKYG